MQYTTNYNLKEPQYADEADIEKINENTEAIDNLIHQNRTMIAPAFDNTKAYVTGDPVEYLGALYVFTADKAAGAWDASKVEPTTAAEMGGGGASALADLDDVEIISPTDGQALVYDDADDTWKNAALPEPVDVVANPSASATDELKKLKVGSTVYSIEGESVTKTATGNPIEITDAAAAPLVKCVTEIQGYQSGSGTPSPDNIRPIVAYTEGEIEVRGKNLFDVTNITEGSAIAVVSGDTITNTSPTAWSAIRNRFNLKSGDYTFSFNSITGTGILQLSRWNGSSYVSIVEFTQSSTKKYRNITLSEDSVMRVSIYPSVANTTVSVKRIMLNTGSSAENYEEFRGTTHTTTYPSAIYRGSEDVVNGEVVTEWGMIASYAGETLPGEWISDRDEYAPGTTPTTGAQVAYALATPTTESITPSNLPIKSLSGYNHIESSTGEMEIEYITQGEQPIIDLIEKSSHIYSTQEQAVGTWIDGKTVYERTIDKSSSPVTVPALQWEVFDTLPEKVNVIDGFSFNYETVGSGTEYTTTPMIFNCDISGHLNVLNVRQNTGMTVMIVTIRYTKDSSNRSLSAPVTSQKSISEPLTDKTEEVPTEEEKTVEKPETEEETNETER